jgi:hypothetical protein
MTNATLKTGENYVLGAVIKLPFFNESYTHNSLLSGDHYAEFTVS